MKKIISPNPQAVAEQFAQDFAQWVNESNGPVHVALSGGSTPKILFKVWASNDCPKTDWSKVHFYWGDERCVPPNDSESNYGVTNQLFFQPAKISESNIHRVLGENDPETESDRYAKVICDQIPATNGLPHFDVMILGMGTDGHTASIFPNQMDFMNESDFCAVATHPESGQKRVTLTGPVIRQSKRIAFLITGASKFPVLNAIETETKESKTWPATLFLLADTTRVYLDKDAAGQ
ncbi:MAG: 6-phosphogluconolactonase [Planctomycetota bacterium]